MTLEQGLESQIDTFQRVKRGKGIPDDGEICREAGLEVGKAGGGGEDGQEVCSAEHGSAMKGGGRVEGM